MNATTYPPLSTDALALCAAIDAGDDSALPILADCLEEAGDPRASGLRLIYDGHYILADWMPRDEEHWSDCRGWAANTDGKIGFLCRESVTTPTEGTWWCRVTHDSRPALRDRGHFRLVPICPASLNEYWRGREASLLRLAEALIVGQ